MAHFAQLNENSVVTQVIVVNNPVLIEPEPIVVDGVMYTNGESETRGIAFCKGLYGEDTNWVQTSYNNSFRGKYAAIGDTFDALNNVFVSPVVESAPVTMPVVESVPVVETPQTTLTSTDLPALTSEQISGL
jgi:hypothetical protein